MYIYRHVRCFPLFFSLYRRRRGLLDCGALMLQSLQDPKCIV